MDHVINGVVERDQQQHVARDNLSCAGLRTLSAQRCAMPAKPCLAVDGHKVAIQYELKSEQAGDA